jgi:hypothetical protein
VTGSDDNSVVIVCHNSSGKIEVYPSGNNEIEVIYLYALSISILYLISFNISRAPNCPGVPMMPPPGWVPEPHW